MTYCPTGKWKHSSSHHSSTELTRERALALPCCEAASNGVADPFTSPCSPAAEQHQRVADPREPASPPAPASPYTPSRAPAAPPPAPSAPSTPSTADR